MSNVYPKFLSKKPDGQDLFEGKSQINISKVISEKIINNDENHKIIGIEGSWGTGKSNLIELLKKELEPKNYTFFIYDVWGHQEDLQRKSILQELVAKLKDTHIVKKTINWDERVKTLTGTVIETKNKSTPKFSLGLVVSFLILITTPILELLSNLRDKNDVKGKILILLIPFFLLAGTYLFNILVAIFTNKETNKKKCIRFIWEPLIKLISVYNSQEIEASKTEFTHESNPSVVDFNSFVFDLSKDLKNNNRLVIVFDNMDRLPSDKVKDLWSSIHTFFAETNYNNITTIVTFDREHVKKAFSETPDDTIGNDYINKTFGIVYRISQPILTDWKGFLNLKWKEAFGPTYNPQEYLRVEQVYDFLGNNENFTPRQLINFVNEIVSIKLVLDYKISETYISIFVLRKEQLLENPFSQIISKEYLGSLGFIYKDDANLDKNIAALIYQIDPEKALSVTYVKQLNNALNGYSTELLDTLKQASFISTIFDDASKNINNLPNYVFSLNYLNEVFNPIDKSKYWKDTYNRIKNDESLEQNNNDLDEYQTILFTNLQETERKEYAKLIINKITPEKSNVDGDFNATGYLEIIRKLIIVTSKDYVFSLQKEFTINSKDYASYINKAKNENEITKISCNTEAFETYVLSLPIEELRKITYLRYVPFRKEFTRFNEVIISKLLEYRNNDLVFFDLLTLLKYTYKDKINLNNFTPDAHLETLFRNGSAEQKCDILALSLVKGYNNVTFATMQNTPSNEDVRNFASILEDYFTFSEIIKNLNIYKSNKLFLDATKLLLTDEIKRDNSVVDIKVLLENFQNVVTITGLPASTVFGKFSQWKILTQCEKKSISYDVLSESVSSNNSLGRQCIDEANRILSTYTEEEWLDSFINNTYGVKEALCINYKWNTAAKDAIQKFILQIAEDKVNPPNQIELWDQIFAQIKTSSNIFKNLRDEFCSGRVKMNLKKFICFFEWLAKYGKLEENPNSLRTIIPLELFDNSEVIQILKKYTDKISLLIQVAKDDSEEYKDRIIESVTNNEDSDLLSLYTQLGLKK